MFRLNYLKIQKTVMNRSDFMEDKIVLNEEEQFEMTTEMEEEFTNGKGEVNE